ncbi:hypothetical protein KAR91_13215, partial [Candidatus Pacearchaeota archaeon]|nr:hypothetical protein [Candidatus Pacearchaeota archaeon]
YLINVGISKSRIRSLGSASEALDILMPQQEKIKEVRDHIHWLLCDIRLGSGDGGEELIEMVRHDFPHRPFISAMSGIKQPDEIQRSIENHADEFLSKGDKGFYKINLQHTVEKVSNFFIDATQAEADAINVEMKKIEFSEDPEETNGRNWYEARESMMDLRNPETEACFAAVLDLDGTLSNPFTMERFVEFLTQPEKESPLDQLMDQDLTKGQQSRNRTALKELKDLFKAYNKKKAEAKKDRPAFTEEEYQAFIEATDNKYAAILQGLKAVDVFDLGEKWCQQDAPQHLHSHALPLVRLLKYLGITPTLITGTPAEAVSGFRKALGITERCHPLELWADAEGRYTGAVKYHTGLQASKNALMKKITKNHQIVLGAGDQQSDDPLFEHALLNEIDAFLGLALYFGGLGEEMSGRFSRHYGERRILDIPYKKFTTGSIVELVIERLHAVMQMQKEQTGLVGELRSKLTDLILDRSQIRNFID